MLQIYSPCVFNQRPFPSPPPPQPPPDLMFAPDGEGVSDDGPLGLPEEGHDLAQVVDQADQVKPVLLGMVRPNIT